MEPYVGDYGGPALPDDDLSYHNELSYQSQWNSESLHTDTDSVYKSMDPIPSDRKRKYPIYHGNLPSKTGKRPNIERPAITTTRSREYSVEGFGVEESASPRRTIEQPSRKDPKRKITLTEADILSRKEKRTSRLSKPTQYHIPEHATNLRMAYLQPFDSNKMGTADPMQSANSMSPVSNLAAEIIAEQFVRSMEKVCSSAVLCLDYDKVPRNSLDRTATRADREEYEMLLAYLLDSYIGTDNALTQQVQPGDLSKILPSASIYIARYMLYERPPAMTKASQGQGSGESARHVRFSHFQTTIGEGGDSCTEPVISSLPGANSVLHPILDPNPAFLAEAGPSNSLLLDIDNKPLRSSQRDPTRSLEDKVRDGFEHLVALVKFRDLAHECHALWYIYFSRRKVRYGLAETVNSTTTGHKQPMSVSGTISTDWDPIPLLQRLDALGEESSIQRILTITGNPQIAYAASCEEYIAKVWPVVGPQFLSDVDDAIRQRQTESRLDKEYKRGHFSSFTTAYQIELGASGISFTLKLDPTEVRTVLQMLAWMSSALRVPDKDDGPELVDTSVTEEAGSYRISTTCAKIETETECRCWMEMLDLAVVAYGFPIPQRTLGRGLEVSLRTACGMIGAAKAIQCAEGPVIQGLSGLLVPIRSFAKGVQWHLLVRQPGQPLRGLLRQLQKFPDRIMCKNASSDHMESVVGVLTDPKSKCYIGWHPKAVSRAGTDSHVIDYAAIRKSGLRSPGQRFQLKNFTIGFQQIVTAEVEIGAIPLQSTLYLRRKHHWFDDLILQAGNDRVLLYDAPTRRGWLLTTAEVVLHLLRRQLMPHTAVELDSCSSAEETLKKNGPKTVQGDLKIQDIIMDKLEVIERLQTELSNFDTNRSFSTKLFGFDFLQCAERAGSFVLREAPTAGARFQQSWVDLVHASDTPVLFGSGFGELIGLEEAEKALTCAVWRQVPCDANLMTATAQVLRRLYAEEPAGDTSGCTSLTHLKLVWDQGQAMLQEACHEPSGKCCCQRVQMLRTRGAQFWRHPVKSPALLPDSGAVIFGDPDMIKGAPKSTKTIASWKRNGVGRERQSFAAGVIAVTEAEVSLGLGEMTQIEERTTQLAT